MTSKPHAPQLLFLPGAGADPTFWKPVGNRLPNEWTKTYLAWPGLGDNAPEEGVSSFDDLLNLAERSLLKLASDGAKVDLVSQSMGGALAIALTLKHPDLVRRLVLTVTAVGLDVEALGAIDWRIEYREEYPQAGGWIYDARPDYSQDLGMIPHPTLLIWGDADPISPPAVGAELKRLLPNASLIVIAGGQHTLALDEPELVASHIGQHLTK